MKVCKGRKDYACVLGETLQEYDNFYVMPRMKDGYSNVCKSCEKVRQSERYERNRTEVLEKTKAYGKANRHVTRKASSKYHKLNKDKSAKRAAKRRAQKLKATPEWLSNDQLLFIESFYTQARDCELVSGEKYHVDHIVPLQGRNVCGLHVPWNLQVLPSDINISKSNQHYEDT